MSAPEFGALPDAIREDLELAAGPRAIRGALTLAFRCLSERLQRVETQASLWDFNEARAAAIEAVADLDEIQRLASELAASGEI